MTRDMNRHRPRSVRLYTGGALALLAWLSSPGCNDAKTFPTRDGGAKDLAKETGPINITGTLNPCPEVVIIASPSRTTVGAQSSLMGNAVDPDKDVLTFRWESNFGTFGSPTLAETTFTCTQPGAVLVKLTVDDGDCKTVEMATLLCTPGDGGLPEHSDSGGDGGRVDGATDGGTTGSGGGTGSGGQGLDAASTGSGGNSGNSGSGGRGSGGNTTTGSGGSAAVSGGASGTAGRNGSGGGGGSGGATAGGSGGTGTSGSGGAPGSGGGSPGAGGSGSGNACDRCSREMCDPSTDGCYDIADPAEKQKCQSAYDCFVAKKCSAGGEALACFCGIAGAACSAEGAADGACLNEVATAANVTPSQGGLVITRFNNGAYPLGRAANLLKCQSDICPTECAANLGL